MKKNNFKIAIITVSDRASSGEYEDLSGPAAKEELQKGLAAHQTEFALEIVADEQSEVKDLLKKFIKDNCDFIFTTGGTGIGERDITPEATKAVIDKEIPGIAEAIRAFSLQKKSSAMLSRGLAGVADRSIIINLPGSPKAVKEILEYITPVLEHAYYMLKGIDIH